MNTKEITDLLLGAGPDLALNLTASALWAAVQKAYGLLSHRRLDRGSVERLLAAVSEQAVLACDVAADEAPVARRFFDVLSAELAKEAGADGVVALLLAPDPERRVQQMAAWKGAIEALETAPAPVEPDRALAWLHVWVSRAQVALLESICGDEPSFRRNVLRLLAQGQQVQGQEWDALCRLQGQLTEIAEVITHLSPLGLRDFTPTSSAEASRRRMDILCGLERTFSDIAAGLDITRDLLAEVWPRIVDVKTPAFLPIAGLAGEGKTTFLKRLAYELWRAGKTVYFVSAQEVGRASVASGLRVLLRKASEPVYVMLDDVELLGASECSACLKVMAEVRKPCVLVGTLNRATWTQMQLFQDAQVEIVLRAKGRPFQLTLSPVEVGLFTAGLVSVGISLPALVPIPAMCEGSLLGFLTIVLGAEHLESRICRLLSGLSTVETSVVRVLAMARRVGLGLAPEALTAMVPQARDVMAGLVAKGIVVQTPKGCTLVHSGMAIVVYELLKDEELVETGSAMLRDCGVRLAGAVLAILSRLQDLRPDVVREALLREWSTVRQTLLPAADPGQLGGWWGPLLTRAGLWPEAEEVFHLSLREGESPTTLNNYANFLWLRGEVDAALAVVRRGLELDPQDGRLLANYARLLYDGRADRARAAEHARAAVSAANHDGLAHYVCGKLREDEGDDEGALEEFHAAIMHRPLEPTFWEAYGNVLMRRGDLGRAADAFATAERVCRSTPVFAWRRAQVAFLQGRHADAVRLYEQAARRLPGEIEILLEWARAYLQQDHYRPGEAWEVCKQLYIRREAVAEAGRLAEAVKLILSSGVGAGVPDTLADVEELSRNMLIWALDVLVKAKEELSPDELYRQYGVIYPDTLPPGWHPPDSPLPS